MSVSRQEEYTYEEGIFKRKPEAVMSYYIAGLALVGLGFVFGAGMAFWYISTRKSQTASFEEHNIARLEKKLLNGEI
jgi:hypothetical protein